MGRRLEMWAVSSLISKWAAALLLDPGRLRITWKVVKTPMALAAVAHLVGASSWHDQNVEGSIPSSDTYLGCRFKPWSKHRCINSQSGCM